jgi:phospholipid transport system substrate-binding protein
MQILTRVLVVLFLALGPSAALTPASAQDGDAEAFISELGEAALQMLANQEITEAQRVADFRRIMMDGFDLPLIGRYALGRYWRRASEAEREEFVVLFESFVVESYAARLGQYSGEKFEVGATRVESDGDSIVRSKIILPSGPAVRVDWRVRPSDGHYKVVDVIVEGISMLITQRDEFSSVIQRSGGQIEGLLASLRERVR